MSRNSKFNLLIYLAIFLAFALKGSVFLDPDFGWRVMAGQHYFDFGIPQTDLYSYTMPNFAWVDHSWTTSLIMGMVYRYFGIPALSVLFSTLSVVGIFLITRVLSSNVPWSKEKIKFADPGSVANICFICLFSILFLFFGVRAQVFSWLGFAFFLWMVYIETSWVKYLLPFYFIAWANLHGSFLMGLGVYLTIIAVRSFSSRKLLKTEMIILLACGLATLLNPYGTGIWREVFSSIFDRDLSSRIIEWMPAITMANLIMVFYIPFSVTFVFMERKNMRLEWLVLYIVFLVEALLSRRHLPLWMVFSYPLTTQALISFSQRIQKIKFGSERFKKVYLGLSVICFLLFGIQFFLDAKEAVKISEDGFYPKTAVEYIRQNRISERIFTDYAWGGYLIWRLPGTKVFIDGRMPSWKGENEFKIMDEYTHISTGDLDYKQVFEKYSVSYVLWPRRYRDKQEITQKLPFLNSVAEVLGIQRKDFKLHEELVRDDWKIIYEDEVSLIFSQKVN